MISKHNPEELRILWYREHAKRREKKPKLRSIAGGRKGNGKPRGKLRLVAVLITTLSGCLPWSTPEEDTRKPDYDRAQKIVVDVWIEKFDYITNGSASALREYKIKEVGYKEIQACGETEGLHTGCYRTKENEVLIYEDLDAHEKECVLVHELIHLLSFYDFGDSQVNHTNELLWSEFGDDTIEAIACEDL